MTVSDYFTQMVYATQTFSAQQVAEERRPHCFAPESSDSRSEVRLYTWKVPAPIPENERLEDVDATPLTIRTVADIPFSTSKEGIVYLCLKQNHTQSRLKITYSLYNALASSLGIRARIEDFIVAIGPGRHSVSAASPPAFFRCPSSYVRKPEPGAGVFEVSYLLFFVEQNNRPLASMPWSRRQSFVYHQQQASHSRSTFLTVSASDFLEKQLIDHIERVQKYAHGHPLEVHVILIQNAVATWRAYILYIEDQADKALVFEPSEHAITDRTDLEPLADEISDVLGTLTDLLEVCRQLKTLINHLSTDENASAPTGSHCSGQYALESALSETAVDIQHQKDQATKLSHKVRRVEQLITDLLELSDSHAMKLLAEQAQSQGEVMQKMTEKANRDAAAVKVLTIITLIYLPATAVLNFFSTDFVTTERRDNGSFVLLVTTNWWIVIVVAVPLTITTIYIWWMYVRLKIDEMPVGKAFLGDKAVKVIEQCSARRRPQKHIEQGLDS